MNRTADFAALVRAAGGSAASSLPSSVSASAQDPRQPISPLAAVASSTAALAFAGTSKSAFTAAVAEVSRDLHLTSSKLQRLTQLVKRRDDVSAGGGSTSGEIEQVTASVQGDLRALDARLDALSLFLAARKEAAVSSGAVPGKPGHMQGSSGASEQLSVQAISHGDAVVTSLKGQLLHVAGGLKGVLQTRTQTVKASADRRRQFGRTAVRDLGRPLLLGAPTGASAAASDTESSHTAITIGSGGSGGGAGAAFQQVAVAQLEPETAYLQARASDISTIEKSISELSGMFSRLATVVMEQGELVDRIDTDVEASLTQITAGQGQLQRYLERVSSNRALLLQVTGILMLFIFIFVFFLA